MPQKLNRLLSKLLITMELEYATLLVPESKPFFTHNFNFYFLLLFRITNKITLFDKKGKFLSKYTPRRMFPHTQLTTSLNRLKSKGLQAKSTFY